LAKEAKRMAEAYYSPAAGMGLRTYGYGKLSTITLPSGVATTVSGLIPAGKGPKLIPKANPILMASGTAIGMSVAEQKKGNEEFKKMLAKTTEALNRNTSAMEVAAKRPVKLMANGREIATVVEEQRKLATRAR
jgi:hypothetical protein